MPAGITFSHGLRSKCANLPELLHLLFHLPNSYLPNFLVYRIIKSGILKLLYLYIIHIFNIYITQILLPVYYPHTRSKYITPNSDPGFTVTLRQQESRLERQEAKAPGHQTRDASVASHSKTITEEVDSWN